jgi:hypothetical protein
MTEDFFDGVEVNPGLNKETRRRVPQTVIGEFFPSVLDTFIETQFIDSFCGQEKASFAFVSRLCFSTCRFSFNRVASAFPRRAASFRPPSS